MNQLHSFLKRISLFGIAAALSLTSIAAQAQQPSKQQIVTPDAQALERVKAGKAYLVDVRTPEEFSAGHLQHATNIDYNAPAFSTKLAKLDKTKPVYLYCRSGNRSGKSTDALKTLGFQEYYNIGGFEKLKEQGFPAEQASAAIKK
ncbi:rhodanese-like domain-containing protein [Dyadobacter sp. CY323]|uniref:rhodanese-like domain-containing protein n=1 Tax=Dyadobacter sp. CY323 TaxID=2907302 RepID=UPI001F219952|nr:rhodanese-like domain-containing protein [Dyadobacter sp. CY323]MCE6992779.1 rhodanese-like domain-containing protein [Dyadobacter sp. CY323]